MSTISWLMEQKKKKNDFYEERRGSVIVQFIFEKRNLGIEKDWILTREFGQGDSI